MCCCFVNKKNKQTKTKQQKKKQQIEGLVKPTNMFVFLPKTNFKKETQ